jgi:hypothetical protein
MSAVMETSDELLTQQPIKLPCHTGPELISCSLIGFPASAIEDVTSSNAATNS